MGFLIRLLLLVALVIGIVVLLRDQRLGRAREDIKADVGSAVRNTREKVASLDVREIADELKRTGRVVRRKVTKAARTVEEVTEDGRTTAAIKTKYALDPDLSALEISVDTYDLFLFITCTEDIVPPGAEVDLVAAQLDEQYRNRADLHDRG